MRNRWRRVPGWKRWSACAIVGIVGISAIGATVQLEDEPSSIRTSDGSTPIGAATTTERTDVPQPSASSPTSTDRTTSTSVTSTSAPPSTTASPSTTPPPAPSATTPDAEAPPAPPGSVASLDVLALIRIERETPEGYNRELFGYGTRVDGFGCRTRALVLIRDSLTPAQIDRGGCALVDGDWFSSYDGLTWSDPGEVQIDHVVALKEAWDSGASQWDAARLEAFANDVDDPRTLCVVTGDVNLAKSANDPVNWLPPEQSALCRSFRWRPHRRPHPHRHRHPTEAAAIPPIPPCVFPPHRPTSIVATSASGTSRCCHRIRTTSTATTTTVSGANRDLIDSVLHLDTASIASMSCHSIPTSRASLHQPRWIT